MNTPDFPFGYCTNVHAGVHLSEAKANLQRFSGEVRKQVSPGGKLPVGLWLADKAATELAYPGAIEQFRDWLSANQFLPYTFNGFPQGDFHQTVVKQAVYEPNWLADSRRDHTILLADILNLLLPSDSVGSISTLPLGWPSAPWPEKGWSAEHFQCAARNLLSVAGHLASLADRTGREIVLAIEPEPGCILDTAIDVIQFFEQYLLVGPDQRIARRFLTVCHDICHSAVMFEPQQQVLAEYQNRGIRVGKVQVSSAIEVPWRELSSESECEEPNMRGENSEHVPLGKRREHLPHGQRWEHALHGNPLDHVPLGKRDVLQKRDVLLTQLRELHEPRYMHQTTRANEGGRLAELAEDFPVALERWLGPDSISKTNWRIHFHIPIFVERFGQLRATRSEIGEACQFLEAHRSNTVDGCPWFTGHYEVETYAWPVLPAELRAEHLADGIAKELNFFQQILAIN